MVTGTLLEKGVYPMLTLKLRRRKAGQALRCNLLLAVVLAVVSSHARLFIKSCSLVDHTATSAHTCENSDFCPHQQGTGEKATGKHSHSNHPMSHDVPSVSCNCGSEHQEGNTLSTLLERTAPLIVFSLVPVLQEHLKASGPSVYIPESFYFPPTPPPRNT